MLSMLPVAPFSTRAFAQYWQWYGVNDHSAIKMIRSNSHPASLDFVKPARRTGGFEAHYDSKRLEIQDGARSAAFSALTELESGESAGSRSKRDRSVAQPAVRGYTKKTAGRDSITATRRLVLLILSASGFVLQHLLCLFNPLWVGR